MMRCIPIFVVLLSAANAYQLHNLYAKASRSVLRSGLSPMMKLEMMTHLEDEMEMAIKNDIESNNLIIKNCTDIISNVNIL